MNKFDLESVNDSVKLCMEKKSFLSILNSVFKASVDISHLRG